MNARAAVAMAEGERKALGFGAGERVQRQATAPDACCSKLRCEAHRQAPILRKKGQFTRSFSGGAG